MFKVSSPAFFGVIAYLMILLLLLGLSWESLNFDIHFFLCITVCLSGNSVNKESKKRFT